ncbi:MAG: putative aminohydrolase SsnA [Alkalispirochaetaceae bacterium]
MILFRNATLMDFDPPGIRAGMDLLVEGREIKAVATSLTPHSPEGEVEREIDCTGKILFPGLVCSHHHYYSGLARGIIAELGEMPDFVSILRQLWWRMDRAHDEQTLYASSLICSMDAIRSGTTAVIDHHASPSCISGSLSTLRRGFEETGLRGSTCYEVTDRHGEAGMVEGVEENRRFARAIDEQKRSGSWSGLMEAHIGGHAPFTLPDSALAALADVCEETGRGFHVHLAEGSFDVSHSHLTYAKDLVERLDEFALLEENTLLAHGIYLSREETELINRRGATLLHNCRSNMNNGVGYNGRLQEYGRLALGTDGIGGDMFEEIRFAFFKHRDAGGPMQPGDFLRAMTTGYRILEQSFGRPFGRLEAGYAADLVVGSYRSPTPLTGENIAAHIAFGLASGVVETVMINGRLVMEERRFPIDEDAIYAEARQQARRLWARMNEIEP